MINPRRSRSLVAGIVALAFLAATALLGAAPATAAPTITVSGVVSASARADVTITLLTASGQGGWNDDDTEFGVDSTSGVFAFTLPKSAKHYSLLFRTGNVPFLDTYLGGLDDVPDDSSVLGDSVFAASANVNLGAIDLIPAAVITGTITGAGSGALEDAFVSADTADRDQGGGDPDAYYTDVSTQPDGSYYLKAPINTTVYVGAQAEGFDQRYYPAVASAANATGIPVVAGSVIAGIDIQLLQSRPIVFGAFYSETDDDNNPPVDTPMYEVYLYHVNAQGHVTSSVPAAAADFPNTEFGLGPVDAGRFGVAFRDPQTGNWLPWLKYAGSDVTPGATGGQSSCLLPVTTSLGDYVDLGKVTVGTTPCPTPYPAGANFSGHVTNYDGHSRVAASLFFVDPNYEETGDEFDSGPLIAVDHVLVDSSGNYSLPAITDAGKYLVYFTASDTAPYLDTWLGDFPGGSSQGYEDALAAAVFLDSSTASPNRDVTLGGATLITGTVRAAGKPVAQAEVGAQVSGEQEGDADEYGPVETDAGGHYSLKVPADGSYIVVAYKNPFLVQYFDHATSPASATPVLTGAQASIRSGVDFALARPAAAIIGITFDVQSQDPQGGAIPGLRATLYKKTAGYWKKTEAEDVGPLAGLDNVFVFPLALAANPGSAASLTPGSYRVRMSIGSHWVPFAAYSVTDLASGKHSTRSGPVCAVQISHLKAHEQKLVAAAIDTTSKHHCAGEPQHAAPVFAVHRATFPEASGSNGTGSGAGGDSSSDDPTDAPTALPTDAPTSAPTSDPAPADPSGDPTHAPIDAANSGFPGILAWAIPVGLVVLLAVIAGGILLFRRRP